MMFYRGWTIFLLTICLMGSLSASVGKAPQASAPFLVTPLSDRQKKIISDTREQCGDLAGLMLSYIAERLPHDERTQLLKNLHSILNSTSELKVIIDLRARHGDMACVQILCALVQLSDEERKKQLENIRLESEKGEFRQQFLDEFNKSTQLGVFSKIFLALLGVAHAYVRLRDHEASWLRRGDERNRRKNDAPPVKYHSSTDSLSGLATKGVCKIAGPLVMFKAEIAKLFEILRFSSDNASLEEAPGESATQNQKKSPRARDPEREALLEAYAMMMSQIIASGTRAYYMYNDQSLSEYEAILKNSMGYIAGTATSVGMYRLLPAALNYYVHTHSPHGPVAVSMSDHNGDPCGVLTHQPQSLRSDPLWQHEVTEGTKQLLLYLGCVPLWQLTEEILGQKVMKNVERFSLGAIDINLVLFASDVATRLILHKKELKIGQLIGDFDETNVPTHGPDHTLAAYAKEQAIQHLIINVSTFTLGHGLGIFKRPVCGVIEGIAGLFAKLLPKGFVDSTKSLVQTLRMLAKISWHSWISMHEQARYERAGNNSARVQQHIMQLPPSFYEKEANAQLAGLFAKNILKIYRHGRTPGIGDVTYLSICSLLWYLYVSGEPLVQNPFALAQTDDGGAHQLAAIGQLGQAFGDKPATAI